jgi:ABC-type dipeptide/oligopeptide/nickel transport system permease component
VLIQATALLIVIIYVVANLVADAVLNPRIRYN